MASLHIQLIDENGDLGISENEFDRFVLRNKLPNKDEFLIISIMGGQSGGKSTLLNYLFDTDFTILPLGERHATTKGIMASFAKNFDENILIMDLEGSDSNEKPESEGETFTRKSALFALAVSEVLIVNIWSHDVGKRSAMNLSVLKSILEVNLKLSVMSEGKKTKILFILRDFDSKIYGSVVLIEDLIRKDVHKIWCSLEKPDKYQASTENDLFEFFLVGIPHKEYQSEGFRKVIHFLKNRFRKDDKNSLFDAASHLRKTRDVPIVALYKYFNSLWQTIKNCDELNIVSQKESLTSMLCEQFIEVCYAIFKQRLEKDFKSKTDQNFGKKADTLYTEILACYDQRAFLDGKAPEQHLTESKEIDKIMSIRLRRREKLRELLAKDLTRLQNLISQSLLNSIIEDYRIEFEKKFSHPQEILANFNKFRDESRFKAVDIFKETTEMIKMKLVPEQSLTSEKDFEEQIKKIELQFISRLIQIFKDSVLEDICKEATKVQKIFKSKEVDVWKHVFECRLSIHRKVDSVIKDFETKALKQSDEDRKQMQSYLQSKVIEKLLAELMRAAEFVEQILYENFDSKFRFDENGVPRRWSGRVNIKKLWISARETCFALLEKYCEIEDFEQKEYPSINDDSKHLINEERKEMIEKKLQTYLNNGIKEAEIQQQLSKSNTPLWIYLLILVLGFNELMWVVKNPILLVIFIITAVYFLSQNVGSDFMTKIKENPTANFCISMAKQKMGISRESTGKDKAITSTKEAKGGEN